MCSKITDSGTGTCTNKFTKFSVKHQSKEMKYDHEVIVHSSGQSECSCRDFKSNKIPCRHICRVKTSQNGMSLFAVETLHPYWHLQNHPLYNGVVGNIVFDSSSLTKNPTVSKIFVSDCQKLFFPSNRRVRFSNLQSLFSELSEVANDCPHLYKKYFYS